MSEIIRDRQVFSLFEVMINIQKTLRERYKSSFWVKAEMNKVNFYKQSGHCYPDLIEKREEKTVAQMRAVLWKDDYARINRLFLDTLNEPLKDGVKILFLAEIAFDTPHGLTLHILDIDPGYTLGDLEREKQETVRRLKEEGIYDRNKLLKIPLLPQRIAVISVETSKGYRDFLGKMESSKYCFFHFLFPSILQGEKIIQSISAQLQQIRKVMHHFDAVAIVRGGGGDVGLSSYNNYQLAKEIALFPLPVLTGVGHITNETVVEKVSCRNLITPTDLANFLITRFNDFSATLENTEQKTVALSRNIIRRERLKFQTEMKLSRSASASALFYLRSQLAPIREKLKDKSLQYLREQNLWLESEQKHVNGLDPKEVLRRGYSMTLRNGKTVKSISQLNAGDALHTLVFDGEIISTVQTIHKEKSL